MMITSTQRNIATLLSLTVIRSASADHPYDWSPSISLVDSASEPDGNGWCPDISGFGASIDCNSMQTHSCKPRGGDTQFAYLDDPELPGIYSVNFDGDCGTGSGGGGCMAVDGDIQPGAILKVEDCQDDSPQQRFVYTTSGFFRISSSDESSYDLCLGVGETIQPAGRFYARDLMLLECDATEDTKLLEWKVLPMPSYVLDDTSGTEADEITDSETTMMTNATSYSNFTAFFAGVANITVEATATYVMEEDEMGDLVALERTFDDEGDFLEEETLDTGKAYVDDMGGF